MKKTICIILSVLSAAALASCGKTAVDPAPVTDVTAPEETERPSIFFPPDTSAEETAEETTDSTETTLPPVGETAAPVMAQTEPDPGETRRPIEEEITYSSEGIPVENAYYSLRLPASWDEKYVKDISFGDNGSMITNFREKSSAEAGMGGMLFSLVLVPGDEDFTAPLYKHLKDINAFDGFYTLYIEYPTSPQYTDGTNAAYNALAGDINTVLDSLMAGEGCIFE